MPRALPKNVAAALGLVPTVLDGVRRLPAKAVQLPVIAVGSALAGVDAAKREYDELAGRGERLLAQLHRRTPAGDVPAASRPATPAGPASRPDEAAVEVVRHDSAASAAVVEQVDAIASQLDAPAITEHTDLPLPDYDHMTLGALRGRLRSLDMTQLVQLRDYEKAKADRLPVVTMLDNRIARLANGESAAEHAKVGTT